MISIGEKYKNALNEYNFVDIFCGIGGFHLALRSFGAKCVFASDIDKEARDVYYANFEIKPGEDINSIKDKDIPAHDILCGGFPCQPFSVSGFQAGFKDEKFGKLFFEIIRIAKHHKPKVILLENVANLERHDNKKTIARMVKELSAIEYVTFRKILCSSNYDIPQSRKRIYIVAFRSNLNVSGFDFPDTIPLTHNLSSLLEDEGETTKLCEIDKVYHIRDNVQVIESECKKPCIRIGEIGMGRQGERIYSVKGCSTTLSANGGGLGGRTGIYHVNNKIRRLTPRECARLMGFPDDFRLAEKNHIAYRQLGNSVVVDVLQHIIIEAIDAL